MGLPWIDERHPVFPHPAHALRDPDGLLAAGGRLNPETLLKAYRQGIFPWFEEQQPVLWWSPSQRAVLVPGAAHISKSLARALRRTSLTITTNRAFDEVIRACAAPRARAQGTWITASMAAAYSRLHRLGYAHSVECWQGKELAGGLYGVQIGGIFCGESMFSRVTNASKIAFACLSSTLKEKGFTLIDCQLENPHLSSLGVILVGRDKFLGLVAKHRDDVIHWPRSRDFQQSLGSFKGV